MGGGRQTDRHRQTINDRERNRQISTNRET